MLHEEKNMNGETGTGRNIGESKTGRRKLNSGNKERGAENQVKKEKKRNRMWSRKKNVGSLL